ncbi:amino acid ABC transporter permease [Lichenicola cladoniae]|uniref:Glutamate/aspartate import permease protein GltK n=1 Tax=Lichenicola cladoniae TaxID=1484109 RepID=A0A6M8HFV9_9PROT|nr:amino acid ABC transporter permease [Lichenicola cladoniae]NPD65255.1 amino acid ABC transporter permease [Acetobacteraceae bacterium]QKE88847.1 amino acid ABC transporter permease [Lichenicola cladoniae]
MDWAIVWNYLPYLLQASGTTIAVSGLSLIGGSILGLALTMLRLSKARPLRIIVGIYVWLIRGTPLLLQIFVVYYWLPGIGIRMPAFTAGVLVLALNSAAYYIDIFRSAILTVPRGQREAALAVGMTPGLVMRRIVLPQALRPALPPYIGQSINLLKNSSLVSVISVQELMFTSQSIYSSTYKVAEILGTAGVLYLSMTSVLQLLQIWLERRLAPGVGGSP